MLPNSSFSGLMFCTILICLVSDPRGSSMAQDQQASAAGVATAIGELRVMSFNIRYGTAPDGDNAWPLRRQLVVDTIRAFQPDLLGTQETLGRQAEALQHDLSDYTYVGWSRESREDGEQCGILFRRDRFELIDSGQFWLSETPDEKFSQSWDSSLPRVVTWVRLKPAVPNQADPAELLFVNTHFDHRGENARRESALLLRRWIESQPSPLPIVVTGDFNCAEGSPPWTTLTESARLSDSFRTVHPEPQESEGTFHGFSGMPGTGRIDWILCSPDVMPRAADIDRHHSDERYPSDHFPVTAILQWQP